MKGIYIKTNIVDFLNEQLLKENTATSNLDLSDRDNVIKWLEDGNGPENIYDEDDGTLDWNYIDTMTGDDLDTLISEYMSIYKRVTYDDEITVYRMIMLNQIEDLDVNDIGIYWSFNEDGVGAYGGVGKKVEGDEAFVLNAIIDTSDIDWEQGFYSYLTFGSTETECNLNKGNKCLITHINDEELETPIDGVC